MNNGQTTQTPMTPEDIFTVGPGTNDELTRAEEPGINTETYGQNEHNYGQMGNSALVNAPGEKIDLMMPPGYTEPEVAPLEPVEIQPEISKPAPESQPESDSDSDVDKYEGVGESGDTLSAATYREVEKTITKFKSGEGIDEAYADARELAHAYIENSFGEKGGGEKA